MIILIVETSYMSLKMSFRFLRTKARCQMDCEFKPHTRTLMIIIFSRQLTLGTEQLLGLALAPPVQVARFCCQKKGEVNQSN